MSMKAVCKCDLDAILTLSYSIKIAVFVVYSWRPAIRSHKNDLIFLTFIQAGLDPASSNNLLLKICLSSQQKPARHQLTMALRKKWANSRDHLRPVRCSTYYNVSHIKNQISIRNTIKGFTSLNSWKATGKSTGVLVVSQEESSQLFSFIHSSIHSSFF